MTYQIPENATIQWISEKQIKDGYSYYEGLEIVTDKGNILLVIEDSQQCCERFGSLFFETPDDVSQFIGAEILDVQDIDIPRVDCDNTYGCAEEKQLRIVTNKGVIQYAIYNVHNGYYSHGTILQVFDYITCDSL